MAVRAGWDSGVLNAQLSDCAGDEACIRSSK